MDRQNIENIAMNIRVLRARKDLTIIDLAKLSGVNMATLSQIENAKKTTIRSSTLYKLAKALNVELIDLIK